MLREETVSPDEAGGAEFITFLTAASAKRHPTGAGSAFQSGQAGGVSMPVHRARRPALRPACGPFREPRTYPARIRFANANSSSDKRQDTRGMSIKVSGAGGRNLTEGESTLDFILNSYPVMMVGNEEFRLLRR